MRTILHLIPTLEGGGAERQLGLLAREQAAGGADVHIGLRRGGPHAAAVERAGVRLHALGDLRGLDPRLVGAMRRLIRGVQPDVVQTWLPQADVCGGLAARLESRPWVMTERAPPSHYAGSGIVEWLRRRLARDAQAIVANSAHGALYWRAQGGPATVAHVSNSVDVAAVREAVHGRAAPRTAEGPLLLSAGQLIQRKAHDVVLRALARLGRSDARFRVIGDGPERRRLESLAKRLEVGAQVEFLPFCLDWWHHLADAALVLSLSRGEGTPNVVLEAMAAGVPLIVSEIPGHRELLDESCALFVPVGDVAAAAAAIRRCLTDPEAARQRAQRAAQRAEQRSTGAVADAYRAVYAAVLAGHGRGTSPAAG
jgi:glycosyltransferase involved in cell wall biosynthesis